MVRDSKTIRHELVALRLDTEVTHEECAERTVLLLQELIEAERIELKKALGAMPFVLSCGDCDASGPDTYEKAIANGWIEIAPDNGVSWNFLGYCRD
jgi:hypothetical protein